MGGNSIADSVMMMMMMMMMMTTTTTTTTTTMTIAVAFELYYHLEVYELKVTKS